LLCGHLSKASSVAWPHSYHYMPGTRQACLVPFGAWLADEGLRSCAFADEQALRHAAEAEAADKASRLRVTQEQLAEWATQKHADAQALVAQAQALQASLESRPTSVGDAACTGDDDSAPALKQQLADLARMLADSAAEAHAFAVLQKAQADNLKRSLAQVRPVLPHAPVTDVDGRTGAVH
jgi:hypothetical protein